jgi:class 3 adenylate cyclase
VAAVWGLHEPSDTMLHEILEAGQELTSIARHVADEWQSHIDLLVEPKGLRLGLSYGGVTVVRRDGVYPGLLLFGNPLNLAARLQGAAQPNQLVCSNSAYKRMQEKGLNVPFEPYSSDGNAAALEARNYGSLKAWVLDLTGNRGKGVAK